MQLPTKKTKPPIDIGRITMMIYGDPKIGKSTFCSRIEDGLFCDLEDGLRYLETASVRCKSIDDVHELVNLLEYNQTYKTLIIDTVDRLWTLCVESVKTSKRIDVLSDLAYGRGVDLALSLFEGVINRISRLNKGYIFISHAIKDDVETVNGSISKFMPSLYYKARNIVMPNVDIIGFAMNEISIDGNGNRCEKRLLRVSPSSSWEAGDRTGRLPDVIPLNYHIFKRYYQCEEKENEKE